MIFALKDEIRLKKPSRPKKVFRYLKSQLFDVYTTDTANLSDSPNSQVISCSIILWLYFNILALGFWHKPKYVVFDFDLSLSKGFNFFAIVLEPIADYLELLLLCYAFLCNLAFTLAMKRHLKVSLLIRKPYVFLVFLLKHYLHFAVIRTCAYWTQFQSIEGSSPEISNLARGTSLLILASLLLHEYLFTVLSYNQSIFSSKSNLLDRSTSTVQLKVLWLTTLLPFIYNIANLFAYEIYLLIYFGICANIAFDFWHYLPYENVKTNAIIGGAYVIGAWSVITQVTGIFSKSDTVTFFLLIIVSPQLLIIYYFALQKRFKSETITNSYNIDFISLRLRKLYSQYKSAGSECYLQQFQKLFYDATKLETSTQLISLWESLFYLKVEKHKELAQVKLAKSEYFPWNLEAQFHMHKFDVKSRKFLLNPEIDYVVWISLLTKAQEKDFDFCKTYINFCNSILQGDDIGKVKELCKMTAQTLRRSELVYSKLHKRYPSDQIVRRYYGSFLLDVLLDSRGNVLLNIDTERGVLTNNNIVNRITSIFSEDTGVLVIGGGKKNAGHILYANPQAAVILNTEVFRINGNELDTYIPPPHNIGHNLRLINFIKHANYAKFEQSHITLLDAKGNLIEVVLGVKAVTYILEVYFLASIRRKPVVREVAIYSKQPEGLKITAHSDGFSRVFNMDSCINLLCEDLMPGINLCYSTYGLYHPFIYKGQVFMFADIYIGQNPILMFYYCPNSCSLDDFIEAELISHEDIIDLNTRLINFKLNTQHFKLPISHIQPSSLISIENPMPTSNKVRFESKSISKHFSKLNLEHFSSKAVNSLSQKTSLIEATTQNLKLSTVESEKKMVFNSLKCMKWLTALLIICTSTLVMTFIFYLSKEMDELRSRHIYEHLEKIPLELTEVGYYARSIELVSSGKIDGDLAEIMEELRKHSGLLYFNVDEIRNDNLRVFKSFYKDNQVTSWEYNQGYAAKQDSLYNTLTTVSAKAFAISNNQTELTDANDFRYLYRNCFDEILDAMNSTNYGLTISNYKDKSEVMKIIRISLIGGLLGFALIYTSVVVLFCMLVERILKNIWSQVLNLKYDFLIEARIILLDRLKMMFNFDYEALEFLENRRVSRRPKCQCYSLPMFLKLFILVPLIISQILFVNFYYFIPLAEELEGIPKLCTWISEQRTVSRLVHYWAREVYAMDIPEESYFEIVEAAQATISPLIELEKMVSRSDQLYRLIFLDAESFESYRFAKIREIPVKDSCTSDFTPTECTQLGVAGGTVAALKEYVYLTTNFIQLSKDQAPLQLSFALINQRAPLHDKLLTFLQDELISTVAERSKSLGSTIISATFGYIAIFHGLLFGLFIPHLDSVKQEIANAKRVLKLRQ